MGSIIGHRIDYNGEGALRGQRHIPSKKLTQVPRLPSGIRFSYKNEHKHAYSLNKRVYVESMTKSSSFHELVTGCIQLQFALVIVKPIHVPSTACDFSVLMIKDNVVR